MEIVQVPHVYRPSLGGVENYVHRLNNSLRERGHEVTTITTDVSLANADSPLDPEPDVVYCPTDITLVRNPFSAALHRQVGRSSADVYHLHNVEFLSTVEAVHALPPDATTILTIHGFRPPPDSPLKRSLSVLYRPVARYVLDRVDRVIVLGETEKRELVAEFGVSPSRVDVVPNGIHPEEYDVSSARVEQFDRRYAVDPATPTVLFVGRLVPLKRPHLLIDAVTDYLDDCEMDVLVVGTGSDGYEQRLRRRADDRIQFLPNLPFDDLKAAYHAADLFAHLSGAEGLPTVILEAMNAELPVIATAVGALPDVLTHRRNGCVLGASPDARTVAAAIRYYVDHPEERERVGARNRELVRDRYNWPRIAEEILSTYARALDHPVNGDV